MIWVDGQILPDDGLAINAADRTFEHGLGLFETLRTWDGRPTLIEAHKARMLRSAGELGLPVDPASFPDAGAVRDLMAAEGAEGDRMLRVTATGGTAGGRSVVWMRSAPPPAAREGGASVCVNAWSISSSLLPPGRGPGVRGVASPVALIEGSPAHHPSFHLPHPDPLPAGEGGRGVHPPLDFTARHKTLNYWFKRLAHEHARELGYDETLILADPWGCLEASRSNLFVVVGDELTTVSTGAPIVPGIMRQLVLDLAAEASMHTREVRTLGLDRVCSADEVFLTNAVRGIVPVARLDAAGATFRWTGPAPWTARLQVGLARRLRGDSPS